MYNTKLQRPLYITRWKLNHVEEYHVLKVKRLLYSMPESPVHWLKTYSEYHKQSNFHDNYMATSSSLVGIGKSIYGLVGIQVDDSICVAAESVSGKDKNALEQLSPKGRLHVSSIMLDSMVWS